MSEEFQDDLEKLLNRLHINLEKDLPKRWNKIDLKFESKEMFEVMFGLFARQLTLAIQFTANLNCWTYDIAPLILRSMADNFINFSWISVEPLERSKKFIYYGLGQEKLVLEHRKAQVMRDGGDPAKDKIAMFMEAWINSQRYTFLTEVNVGAWSGINTRQMAEEANCLDFYTYVYTPFSAAVHNTWAHVAKYNLEQSDNPLHKFIRTPVVNQITIDVYNLKLSIKYVDKLTRKFDEIFGLAFKEISTYEAFLKDFDAFENKHLKS